LPIFSLPALQPDTGLERIISAAVVTPLATQSPELRLVVQRFLFFA